MEVTPTQLVTLLREGTAPQKARAAIARCTVPMPPAPLLESLDILADDPEPVIQAQALSSLERLPAAVVRGVASSPGASPELLERIARRFPTREDVALDVARNPAAADATLAHLAAAPLPAVLAAIGAARERLGRSPEIVAALLANPATPLETVRLWQERGGGRPAAEPAAAPAGTAGVEAGETEHSFETVLVDEEDDVAAEVKHHLLAADEAQSARQASIYSLLKKMTMGQKVALAVKGNREVRNILIRENNKMLCLKVLENPRVGDSDIEAWAKSTNVPEDVLRGIAGNKEWVRKYSIMRALVSNPKAPLGVTIDFLKWMTLKDLEQLTKNRNVPETLRSAARRLYMIKRDKK